ncbi:MAG TPA: helix-turn-helix transcriptional regulator [Candidatus Krumholzibacteria bacterium]
MKTTRLDRLPETMRHRLKEARLERGWSQLELGRRAGLPQMHISGIETGKITPRYDTLLDLVRLLGHDLVMVPRALVPAVQALVRDYRRTETGAESGDDAEQPLYAAPDTEDESERRNEL